VPTIEPIKITGLAEFNRNLRKISADLPKELRLANNAVAQIIVDWARPKIPSDSGAAAKSLKVRSTRTEVRVQGGSRRVAYYPWLDFGGRVGPKRSVARPFYSDGRYIYPALAANRDELYQTHVDQLVELVRRNGLEVTA
jgi:hypothetical protein